MLSHKLLMSIIILIGLTTQAWGAISTVQIQGDDVYYDTLSDAYWYPLMEQNLTSMTYRDQLTAIENLTYAGMSWSMANNEQVESLFQNSKKDLLDAFDLDNNKLILARHENISMYYPAPADTHYYAGISHRPFMGYPYWANDNLTIDNYWGKPLGAWVVGTPETISTVPVPTPSAALLCGIGACVTTWLKRWRFAS